MTEQEKQAMIAQLNAVDIFTMIPHYQELSKTDKENVVTAFENLIQREKTRLSNEQ